MSVSTATVGNIDLNAGGYLLVRYELPAAGLTEWGMQLQDAGRTPPVSAYNDAPWSMTVRMRGADADASKDLLAALTLAASPGATLTWAEDGAYTCSSIIHQARLTEIRSVGGFVIATYSGTRHPAWQGVTKAYSFDCDLFGTADLPIVPRGTLEASTVMRVRPAQATESLAMGIVASPAADFTPVDDYSGLEDSSAWQGQRALENEVTTSELVATAPNRDANANRGPHRVYARVKSENTAVSYEAASTVTPGVGSPVTEKNPAVAAGSTSLITLDLGRVTVPVQDIPGLPARSAYSTALTTYFTNTTGTDLTGATNREFAQTFTLTTTTLLTEITVKACAITGGVGLFLYTTDKNGLPDIDITPWASKLLDEGGTSTVKTFTVSAELNAGTYAIGLRPITLPSSTTVVNRDTAAGAAGGAGYTRVYGSGGWEAGDGTDSTVDYYVAVRGYAQIAYGISTPIYASAGSAYDASVDVVARIPLDRFAVLIDRTANAGEGFEVDTAARSLWVASASETGASLSASGSVLGLAPGFAPGVTNRVVCAGDTGTSAPTRVTISGEFTEQWLDPREATTEDPALYVVVTDRATAAHTQTVTRV